MRHLTGLILAAALALPSSVRAAPAAEPVEIADGQIADALKCVSEWLAR